ncbi:Choline transporter-like protein 2 [Bagarius yarrelli]|uniref:Choline transporter-like protein 2 n=1 Tax=Bagarius yarrelli TaxID=175774 RepID=A0A556TVS7_BAGYA|nr:Choline transporter-like protein 2 [Bagarius yarrelli]
MRASRYVNTPCEREPRKYDPSFKGPIHNRGCTDIICCILFVLAILGYVVVGILAWSQGDPRKVIYPTNSRGEFCGQAGTPLEKKPYLFYFNILKCASPVVLLEFQCPTTQICVEKCPDRSLTLLSANVIPKDWDYYKNFCIADPGNMTPPEILKQGLCPAVLLPSKPFTRRCFPALGIKGNEITIGNSTDFVDGQGKTVKASDLLPAVKNATIVAETRMVVMKIFEDFTQSWYWIILGLVIATILSLIFIVLLRFLAGIMVWVMIVMVILVIGYGIIILAIVEVIIILLLIFLRKRILIAIALIKEASSFLSTSNEAVYKVFNQTECIYARNSCNPENYTDSEMKKQCPQSQCLFAFYGGESAYHKYLILLQFYNVFLFFWCANFVTALGQMTLAGAFASYYWAFNKSRDMPACPVFASFGRALRYHTGSLAFGSLILAIVQIIRVLLEYLDHKLKGVISFFFFSGRAKGVDIVPNLHYYWVPILTIAVGSYLIAHGFFSVYAMCVDTLFLCFCEDLERNDGSAARPYYMSSTLHDILTKNPDEPAIVALSTPVEEEDPVQEWGEEFEDGAVFGITLRRERVQQSDEVAEASPCSAYVQYRTSKVRRLKAATLKRVVDHLLDPCCQEQDYGRILLSTYRTFISTNKLIELLLQRDSLDSELDNSKCHKSALWNLLQTWLDEFAEDFRDPPMHSSLRAMCLQLRRHNSLIALAKCYEDLLKKYQAEDVVNKDKVEGKQEPELSQEEKDLDDVADFMDFSVTELGEQLTKQDARDKKENPSPTISATISQFNAITNRVITSLLCPSTSPSSTASSTPNQRAKIIERWIRVAQTTNNGAVPYLGTYLTVLTMLDTALPDTVEHDYINFEKRRREYEILWQIRQLQASCSQYTLPNHPQIAAWLQHHTLLTDQESYELSRELEPPVDNCSPSNSTASNPRSITKKLTSLLNVTESSKKNADQISVSSSGSSSSEMEDLSSNQSSPLGAQSLSSSCQNVADSSTSSSPTSSSSSSTSSQVDLIFSAPSTSLAPSKPGHKRSVSMTALPLYNRQVADSCIIRISVESSNNGNMYKSILVTSQEKTAQVIERALQKHNLENVSAQDFSLVQMLAQGKELIIPDKANVFYAMSTSANYDFVLRRCSKGQRKQLGRSASMSAGRSTK